MEHRFSLSDYNYHLPDKLIAQKPAFPRDSARLLVYNRETGGILDRVFNELPSYLESGTTLVMNNSRVEKARLLFENREIFLLDKKSDTDVTAMVRPGKKFQKGISFPLTPEISVEVLDVYDDGTRLLRFSVPINSAVVQQFSHTPFPPYIHAGEELADEYQTVYAKESGSKAAPTAGLHFTGRLLDKLKLQHFGRAEVTLHVGLGTFAPVKTDDIRQHAIHSEWYSIDADNAARLNKAHHRTAVGTTSVRVLESAAALGPAFYPHSDATSIYIYPGYEFRKTDALITNFHLPKSSLLMLVAAMVGLDELHRIYKHAVKEQYRFFSFGDAMLIR